MCWCVARDDVHACGGCLRAHGSARACGPVVTSWRTPPPRAPFYLTPALSIPFLLPLFLRLANLQKTPLSAHISFYSSGEWLWLVPLIKNFKKTSPQRCDKKCCCQLRLPQPIVRILPPRPQWLEQKAKKKENLVKCPLLILICSVIIQCNCFIYPVDTSQYNVGLLREESAEQNQRTITIFRSACKQCPMMLLNCNLWGPFPWLRVTSLPLFIMYVF